MKLGLSQLDSVLHLFYEHLTPCWRQFHIDFANQMAVSSKGGDRQEIPAPLSRYMCRHTSAFILKQLKQMGVQDIRSAGGVMRHAQEGDPDFLMELTRLDPVNLRGRYADEGGFVWEPHFWLEHNGYIIDITKDQFGWNAFDILEVDTTQVYRKSADKSKMSYLSSLRSTVLKFEGEPQTAWQERNPHYALARTSFAQLIETVAERIATPPLLTL